MVGLMLKDETKSAPPSFCDTFNQLADLLSKNGTPREIVSGAFEVFEHLDKCLIVKTQLASAPSTSHEDNVLEATDLFMRYVSAVRACDWPLVSVIEHELRS
jgi:hypothetical protein